MLSHGGRDGDNDGSVAEGARDRGSIADAGAVRGRSPSAVGGRSPSAVGNGGGIDGITTGANGSLESQVLLVFVARADSLNTARNAELAELLADAGEVVGVALGVGKALEDNSLLKMHVRICAAYK